MTTCVGIEQKLMRIESVTRLRLIRPMDAVSINSGRSNIRQINVPNLVGVFREYDSLEFTFAPLVEQTQLHFSPLIPQKGQVPTPPSPACPPPIGQTLFNPP